MFSRRSSARILSLCVLVIAQVILSSPANASPGDLDSTFGDGGRVVTGFDGSLDDTPYYEMDGFYGRAFAVAIQADGKIVLAGEAVDDVEEAFGVARHMPDGTLDPSFGGSGAFQTTFAAPSAAHAVAIQADGKIVVVGTTGWTGYPGRPRNSFALARYTTDGRLDASFGAEGTVRTRFNLASAVAYAVAIQPDGKLIVAGRAGRAFALARYGADGSLDTSFGSDGKLRARFLHRPLWEAATDVVIQADGGILMSGSACDTSGCSVALGRYLPDSSLDESFGEGGMVLAPIRGSTEGDLALQADGRIVVGAGHFLFRFDPDGSPDTSFSDDGWVRTATAAYGVGLQADGKIVVTGPGKWEPFLFTVARFDSAGVLDRSFGDDGRAQTGFPGFDNVTYALAVQADGKIVVVGTTSDINIDGKFALARFLAS